MFLHSFFGLKNSLINHGVLFSADFFPTEAPLIKTLLLTFLLSYGTAMRFWLGLTLSLFTLQTIASILSELYLLGTLTAGHK